MRYGWGLYSRVWSLRRVQFSQILYNTVVNILLSSPLYTNVTALWSQDLKLENKVWYSIVPSEARAIISASPHGHSRVYACTATCLSRVETLHTHVSLNSGSTSIMIGSGQASSLLLVPCFSEVLRRVFSHMRSSHRGPLKRSIIKQVLLSGALGQHEDNMN